jgi:hypothetical protein
MRFIALCLLLLTCATSFAASSHTRKAHIRKDGTYVSPSRATNPNKTSRDNYSHKGNVNPYTGAKGSKK